MRLITDIENEIIIHEHSIFILGKKYKKRDIEFFNCILATPKTKGHIQMITSDGKHYDWQYVYTHQTKLDKQIEQLNDKIVKFYEPKIIYSQTILSLGGHQTLQQVGTYFLDIYNNHIRICNESESLTLNYNEIEDIRYRSHTRSPFHKGVVETTIFGVIGAVLSRDYKNVRNGIVVIKDKNGEISFDCYNANNVYSIIKQRIPENVDELQDPFELIKKFKELLDLGIVTQEEFDKKKKELLKL